MWENIKFYLVVATYFPSIYWAFRTKPKKDAPEFSAKYREWTLKYGNLFAKFTLLTDTKLDDRFANAIITVASNLAMWNTVIGFISSNSDVKPSEERKKRQTLIHRIREYLANRKYDNTAVVSPYSNAVLASADEKEAGSITVAVAILAMIASSASIFEFIRKWRNRNNG